jgi:hypothetical protein
VSRHLVSLFNSFGTAIRKANAPRRFDREKAMKPLFDEMQTYWSDGIDALFGYMGLHDGWDKVQRHIQMELASAEFSKTLSDADRQFIANLLVNFSYFSDVDKMATTIMEATSIDTFEDAAKFAMQQIGIGSPNFELKNTQIREALLARTDDAIFATKSQIDSTFDTIINQFYELGRNPYNQTFIDELRQTLNVKTDWEAKRFALTETGIAAEMGAHQSYRRNGVQEKRWNITGANTRETHAELSGVEIGIDETFDVGGSPAQHPLDPQLPAEELVNCHCWESPVVNNDFKLDPSRIWEGA